MTVKVKLLLLVFVALPLVALPPDVLWSTEASPLVAVWLLVLTTFTKLWFMTVELSV